MFRNHMLPVEVGGVFEVPIVVTLENILYTPSENDTLSVPSITE